MASMVGMDVELVRQFATLLGQKADAIKDIRSAISSKMPTDSQWRGTDATNFRNDWKNQDNQLKTIEQNLRDVQKKAKKNADDQENVSKS